MGLVEGILAKRIAFDSGHFAASWISLKDDAPGFVACSPQVLFGGKAKQRLHGIKDVLGRRDTYVRHGVVNIFMANEPLMGKRYVQVTEFKTKMDWAKFVKRIADEWYPKAKKIKLVMDNFKTHDASAI